jgi:hypothetical protein
VCFTGLTGLTGLTDVSRFHQQGAVCPVVLTGLTGVGQ